MFHPAQGRRTIRCEARAVAIFEMIPREEQGFRHGIDAVHLHTVVSLAARRPWSHHRSPMDQSESIANFNAIHSLTTHRYIVSCKFQPHRPERTINRTTSLPSTGDKECPLTRPDPGEQHRYFPLAKSLLRRSRPLGRRRSRKWPC